ncbi:hypothetical protein O981_27620 [Mycobacterium avium 10-5560]|nr:hypothetical protein O981_27620 [Mycobacterium avium 10-5560]
MTPKNSAIARRWATVGLFLMPWRSCQRYAALIETPVWRVMASAAAALDRVGSEGLRIVRKSLLSLIDSSEGCSVTGIDSLNVLSFLCRARGVY